MGVVAAITPWNAPMMLMAMKLAPALSAGCTFVLKPSEHAPASTLAFAKLVEEAGIPPGVFNVVTGDADAAAAIGDDRLQKQSQGYVVPESFTHGSSAQRVDWFKRGLNAQSLKDCDTFSASNL